MNFSNFFNIPLNFGEGKNTIKKLSTYKNNLVFWNVFSRLLTDTMASMDIENTTDTMDDRIIKQSLIWYASVGLIEKDGNFLSLPSLPGGNFNIYGNPQSGFSIGFNGWSEQVNFYLPGSDKSEFLNKTILNYGEKKAYNAVFVRDNELCYPLINVIIYFAECIADAYRTLDVCRENTKQPYIITAEESIVNSVKEFFKKRNNNESFIISSGIFPADKINLLPFETNESNITTTTGLIDWYENKFKEIIGMDNNTNIDKKGENLITDEISINEEYTNLSLQKRLDCINRHLDIFNELYGQNLHAVANKEIRKEEISDYDDISGDENEESEYLSESN